MQIERLVYFLVACKSSSITEAAIRCNVTQQTVSIAIKELEEVLQVTLFQRSKQGISLTTDGQKIYPQIEKILTIWNNISSSTTPLLEDTLFFGNISLAISTALAFFTTDIIERFSSLFPKINISVKEIPAAADYEQLLSEKHDAIIYALPTQSFSNDILTKNSNYEQSVLSMDTIAVMVAKSSPYAKYKLLPKKANQWSWIYYNVDNLEQSFIHTLLWGESMPSSYLHTNNYSVLFDSIIKHNYAAITGTIIKQSSYYHEKQLSLIQLPTKINLYYILAVKNDRLNEPFIQSLVTILKDLLL